MLAIMFFSALISTAYFFIMKKLNKFRIDKSIEIIGLDIAEMGGLSDDLYNKIKRDVFSPTNSYITGHQNSMFRYPSDFIPG